MKRPVSSRFLVSFLLVLLLPLLPSCTDHDADSDASDDDVDDDTDDDADDDTDDDVDDDADDDTGPTLDHIEVTPGTRAIPVDESKSFIATAYYDDGSSSTDAPFVFSSSDPDVLMVDQDGLATGVENGAAQVIAELDGKQGSAKVLVGPDLFFYDGIGGFLGAYDRGTGQTTDDYLAARKGPVATIPSDLDIVEGKAYVLESGDFAPGTVGTEGFVIVDLYEKTTESIVVEGLDNPWSAVIDGTTAYITGNLSNDLVVLDLADQTAESVALPEGCVPTNVALADSRVFVSCSRFEYVGGDFIYGEPGWVLAYDPAEKALTTIETSQVNPSSLALSLDGASLYVACTGNYADKPGTIDQIDLATDAVVDTIELGSAPTALAIHENGKGFLADGLSGSVYVIDTADNSILRGTDNPIAIDGAFWIADLAIDPWAGNVLVADWTGARAVILDAGDYSILGTPAMNNAKGFAFWE